VTVAAKGGEVAKKDIERGTKRANALLWIEGEKGPFAVAALKAPLKTYREGVFKKAGAQERSEHFTLELGYIYVEKKHRRKGLARTLVREALAVAGKQGIYATTRADNDGMRAVLEESGFIIIGSAYPSARSDSRKLLLWGKPPAKRTPKRPR
jgi:GNAT superfamily N-acetyltransferase